MTTTTLPAPRSRGRTIAIAAVIAIAVAALAIPGVRTELSQMLSGAPANQAGEKQAGSAHDKHGHDEHGHEHASQPTDRLTLSEQAQRNIGLQLAQVKLQAFERTISIPGIVVERPGRSTVEVTAPLTGVVTRIYPIRGQAVTPGEPLFELRLTHEDLVLAQRDFLRTAEELDVIAREIARLEKLTSEGAIAAKAILERQYEQQKGKAALRAQHQALLLHGLSEQQVAGILETRSLLQFLTVTVPFDADQVRTTGKGPIYQVEELKVERGQYFNAGDTLAVLTDHAQLFIEGNAFEKDLADVNRAVDESRPIAAVLESEGSKPLTIAGLKLLYLAGRVDPDSRAFHFYVMLPNALLRDKADDGHRFITWRYKPGQRMKLQIPVEQWAERIVLPIDAIAQDGAELYVFQPSGKQFIRRPVHVEYRDPLWAVIANDGSLFPGDQVATSGAQQMQLAIKNQSGGAIDPHAGHQH